MIETDVVIVGAGPAGAAAGLVLARAHRVCVIDRTAAPPTRIGESLIPAARRLLRDIGVLEAVDAAHHGSYFGNEARWGEGPPQRTDFILDPDGPGWHLDRARFERLLRAALVERGATVIAPARVESATSCQDGGTLRVVGEQGAQTLRAGMLIDATGRSAGLARHFGARRLRHDALVARWIIGEVRCETSATAGFSTVHSAPDGWWYSAPLSKNRRVLSFHTDHDLADRNPDCLVKQAGAVPGVAHLIEETGFCATEPERTCAAHSASLLPVAGERWLAVGDAATSFDPLSSQGIFHALYTGLKAGRACAATMHGASEAVGTYVEDVQRIRAAYSHHLTLAYASERRWPDQPFWARRQTQRPYKI